jgi:hypothetical protein
MLLPQCENILGKERREIQMIRCYSELKELTTLEARFKYLSLKGSVGKKTFGWDRYFNQRFYHSPEWKAVRRDVILRDNGSDLGIEGYKIHDKILIHHMNPIWLDDLRDNNEDILNPEFLICTSSITHQAIHYGDISLLPQQLVVRTSGDTRLWRRRTA